MTDRCPECGRPLGTVMETHPDRPGLLGSLRGEGGEPWRVFVLVGVCVIVVLAATATKVVFG